MIGAFAHLAFWAAAYVTAGVVCAAQLLGVAHHLAPAALLYAWSTALFAYLLDRVKVRDAWMDPADRLAHPKRYAYLHEHRHAARWIMLGAAGVSLLTGWVLHPIAAAGTVATVLGVLAYAGRPRTAGAGPRIKDRFIVKNLFVGVGIAGFAVLIASLVAVDRAQDAGAESVAHLVKRLANAPLGPALTFAYLTLRVYADAVLCDIDDEEADRVHDTRTLPTRFGGERAWVAAMWLRLALAASLLCWPAGPFAARVAWAVVSAAGTVMLRWWRPQKVRDLVDARFGIEAACVWIVLAGFSR